METFDRDAVKKALRFTRFVPLQPLDGVGTVSLFDVEIPGLIKILDCKLRRRQGEPLKFVGQRIEGGGFAVDMPRWLCAAILEGAVAALRERLRGDLATLAEVDDAPIAPGVDGAALPANLMREVR